MIIFQFIHSLTQFAREQIIHTRTHISTAMAKFRAFKAREREGEREWGKTLNSFFRCAMMVNGRAGPGMSYLFVFRLFGLLVMVMLMTLLKNRAKLKVSNLWPQYTCSFLFLPLTNFLIHSFSPEIDPNWHNKQTQRIHIFQTIFLKTAKLLVVYFCLFAWPMAIFSTECVLRYRFQMKLSICHNSQTKPNLFLLASHESLKNNIQK